MLSNIEIKSAIESLLFIWGEPLPIKMIGETLDVDKESLDIIISEMIEEYNKSKGGLKIRRIDKMLQMVTSEENDIFVKKLCTPIKTTKLSQAALEVLTIITYKQPITRVEIENIRGIKCERVLEGLMKKNLICEKGRSDALGRPILYGTTTAFLEYMNIKSLKDLPPLKEFEHDSEVLDYHNTDGQISFMTENKER